MQPHCHVRFVWHFKYHFHKFTKEFASVKHHVISHQGFYIWTDCAKILCMSHKTHWNRAMQMHYLEAEIRISIDMSCRWNHRDYADERRLRDQAEFVVQWEEQDQETATSWQPVLCSATNDTIAYNSVFI